MNYQDVQNTCVQQLKRISQQKEQILLSFHEDSMMDTIYKEDSKLENSQCTMEDNILENSSMLNIFEKSYTPENKNIDTLLNPLKEQVIVLLDKHISLKKKKLDLKIFFQLTSTLKTNIIVYCTVNKNLKKKQNVIYLQEKNCRNLYLVNLIF
ncbi:hypothetical protein APICC_09240 [Apis cerana cerana]|uniref:Uncharacterized protein n=1 Tax=Apis cerana cerana TaxID=94128 RepID=A0A2A3E562_APICC|nr:hypothetical protein APICC_09240 [Apis cerana cerana]